MFNLLGAVQCSIFNSDMYAVTTLQNSEVKCGVVHIIGTQFNTGVLQIIEHSLIQCSAVKLSAIQLFMKFYSIVQIVKYRGLQSSAIKVQ